MEVLQVLLALFKIPGVSLGESEGELGIEPGSNGSGDLV